jgi:CO/xanthine dehydrogenase Mo-binding subunit
VLTVHDTTRWITGERTALAAYLGIPETKVRILSPLVGGAFGSKSFLWMHVALCAVAAREVGRPVKLVLTRDQMFSSTGHRPRTEQHLSLAHRGQNQCPHTVFHAWPWRGAWPVRTRSRDGRTRIRGGRRPARASAAQ